MAATDITVGTNPDLAAQSVHVAPVSKWFGMIRGARNDPLDFFVNLAQSHEIVEIPNPFGRFYLVNHPDFVSRILQHNYKNYPKSPFYQRVRPIFGEGLFELEGARWKQKRQCVQPAFHRDGLEALAGMMVREITVLLDQWEGQVASGKSVDIVPELMEMTFRVITRALCSCDLKVDFRELSSALTVVMREGERVLWALVPGLSNLPSPRKSRLHQALKVCDDFIFAILEERRRSSEDHNDLLAMLLSSKSIRGDETISDDELRDDLLTMLIAGHETTAMAIAWACVHMSLNPCIRQEAQNEVDAVLGGRLPRVSDLSNLKFVRMIIDEAMRLYPPFWTISRQALSDDWLGPYHIPAGATLMLCPYVVHRNSRYWQNPEGFDPERFRQGNSPVRNNGTYFPFGGGPRVCLGQNFALMEAQLYLAMLIQRLQLDLVPGQKIEAEPMISLRPKHGVHMTVSRTADRQEPLSRD